jgi:hypothetical protein
MPRCDSPAVRCVRTGVGILRYFVQGFGWEVGSQAARASIDELKRQDQAATNAPAPTRRQLARAEKERAKQVERDRKEYQAAVARNRARIESELQALKKKASR